MPGGYASPFSNPCGQDPWRTKCGNYDHAQPQFTAVGASVNVTGGPLATGDQFIPTGGSPELVNTRPLSGSAVGASGIDDAGYKVNYWPPFFANPDGTNIRRPANEFAGAGTVDLSGPCRQVGFVSVQAMRKVHGRFGYDTTNLLAGATCSSYTAYLGSSNPADLVFATTKYRTLTVSCSVAQGCGWEVIETNDSDGSNNFHGLYTLSGSATYAYTSSVNAYSGEITVGGTDTQNTLFQRVETSGTDPTITTNETGSLFATLKVLAQNMAYECTSDVWSIAGYVHDSPTMGTILSSNASTFVGGATSGGLADPFNLNANGFVVTSTTLSHSATSLIVEIVLGPGPSHSSDTDGISVSQTQSGTATLHIEYTLSDPVTYADMQADCDSMIPTDWATNRIKFPLRTDGYMTIAPLWTRNERSAGVSPDFTPASTTNDTNGGAGYFTLGDPLNPGSQRAWYDVDCYAVIYTYAIYPAVASPVALELIYDGSVVNAMGSPGEGDGTISDTSTQARGYYDFGVVGYSGAGCPAAESGGFTPGGLPAWCHRWTPLQLAAALWPCEFVAWGVPTTPVLSGSYTNDQNTVFVQRYTEAKIAVPSLNPTRPYGADKLTLNYSAVDGCDGDGNPTIGGAAISAKWPACPGLTFDDVPMVGGRVRVLAVDGTGVATLGSAQTYFSTPTAETVNIYDANMTFLGTVPASRVDDTHFGGFGAHPSASWITPTNRTDPVTGLTGVAWVYSDCDDFPKGHWVIEDHVFNVFVGASNTGSCALQCAKYVDCAPVMLRAVAGNPAGGMLVTLALIRQWDTDPNWQQVKTCSGGTPTGTPVAIGDCTTWPPFIEATSLTPVGVGQVGGDGCGAAETQSTPWNFYQSSSACPNLFP